ncbi:hypothetical protein BDF22DRAFT_669015, partial [Syncephalis plumigaleata]
MPNNRKHTLKNIKGKHVAHPYSRKAHQITRSLLRTERLGQRKKERDTGIGPIAERYIWFGEMLANTSRTVLSHTELFSLVEIYMKRHDDEMERLRKQRKYGNRPKSAREHLLASIITSEYKEFYGNGIDIPDITNEANVELLLSQPSQPRQQRQRSQSSQQPLIVMIWYWH